MSNANISDNKLSVVIPMFNEETNINLLVNKLEKIIHDLNRTYEIILIDDGSTDHTWDEITKLGHKNSNVKGISFTRNFGHQNALLAGFQCSSGNPIITMDADLQHPPEVIEELYKKWREGYMVVNTKRISDDDISGFKKITSKYYYKIFSFLTGVPIYEGSSDFRLIDRKVLDSFINFNDREFFIRGIVNWVGFPSYTVNYKAGKRYSGTTKYSLKKMLKFAFNGIICFSSIPLKIGIWFGVMFTALAFLEIVYAVIQFFRGFTVPGWASIIILLSLLFGILFILIGFIGIYTGNIYECIKNRPRFIVRDKLNT